jgi:hypothetical protein
MTAAPSEEKDAGAIAWEAEDGNRMPAGTELAGAIRPVIRAYLMM